ncbi:MAG: galactokinase [Desulfosarcina sp.]|nr:galactokinase [Desulfosarcina sp.]MBC2742700.1 galactokinase [Desulfosarcina sp.]MBC2765610.1 galactokinase [Desulfosarcina sp.]
MTPHENDPGLGNIGPLLDNHPIDASAPCRIDFGGTLDISSFHYPLRHLVPSTVNIALDRRTTVTLRPTTGDRIRISSEGFADAVFNPSTAPYDHPLGLMFAVTDYFNARGVHIHIHSASPPRSGLGGSSVAAVALIAAFSKVLGCMGKKEIPRERMVLLAHAIEQGVAGVACGLQDQLAAAFGGVNAWTWPANPDLLPYAGRPLLKGRALRRLDRHLIVAYLGVTHVSKDVNRSWVRQFITGKGRENWHEIVRLTHDFAGAIARWNMTAAADAMNRETAIRKAMTPQVLDDMGDRLAAAAIEKECGARFTGAGGGGCLWALGEADAVAALKPVWKKMLAGRPTAGLLDCRVDANGVM